MKQLLLIFCILGMGRTASGQTNTFPSNGNVGIGTTTPQEKVEVNGNILVNTGRFKQSGGFGGGPIEISDRKIANTLGINWNTYYDTGWKYRNTDYGATLGLDVNGNLVYFANPLGTANDPVTSWGERLRITSSGNVGIGTASPSEKLSVNGKIRAKEIKVETGWADFVFKPFYKLLSLSETEQFIKMNGHLPGIPSEKEVALNGINLGEMNAKLLEKIEELTLHLIEKDKKLTEVLRRLDIVEHRN